MCVALDSFKVIGMKHFDSGLKLHMGHIKNFYHVTSNQIHDFECIMEVYLYQIFQE